MWGQLKGRELYFWSPNFDRSNVEGHRDGGASASDEKPKKPKKQKKEWTFEEWLYKRSGVRQMMMVSSRVKKLPCGCLVVRGETIITRMTIGWAHRCHKVRVILASFTPQPKSL
jgi:hypothetical protein